ncbi:MAG: hypothetical protein U1E55_09250 [Paracoccus sp. (in: a-proteobacteria)]
MHRFLTVLPFFVLLSACSPQLEITKPPVAYKTLKSFPPNAYRGDAKTTVRTKVKTKDGSRELAGASCSLTTPYSESQFQTPAYVMTPNLGPSTPTANLICKNGERSVQKNLVATNISLNERSQNARNSGAGAGIIGAVVSGIAAGINEGRGDQPTDVHGYHDIRVDMGDAGPSAAK